MQDNKQPTMNDKDKTSCSILAIIATISLTTYLLYAFIQYGKQAVDNTSVTKYTAETTVVTYVVDNMAVELNDGTCGDCIIAIKTADDETMSFIIDRSIYVLLDTNDKITLNKTVIDKHDGSTITRYYYNKREIYAVESNNNITENTQTTIEETT